MRVVSQYLSRTEKGNKSLALLALLWLTFFPSAAIASEATEAFQEGNYQLALELFSNQAQANPSEQLHFNIAVCHYKLQQWQQAEKSFQAIWKHNPDHERARLNLALAQAKQGKIAQALEHLDWLSLAAIDDTVAEVAYSNFQQLSLLPKEQKVTHPSASQNGNWMLSASVTIGTDDNVLPLAADEDSSHISTQFVESSLYGSWYSSQNVSEAWVIDGSWYRSTYDKESTYDTQVLGVGIKKNIPLSQKNQLAIGVKTDQTQAAGHDYLQTYDLALGGRYQLSKERRVKYGVRYRLIKELASRYQSQAGNSWRLYCGVYQNTGSHTLGLRYLYDLDDKNGSYSKGSDSEAATFRSYSANRHTIRASWEYSQKHWYTYAGVSYRASEYLEQNRLSDGSQKLRIDDKISGMLSASYQLVENLSLEAQWQHTQNNSSIKTYDYDQNLITASLIWAN